MTLVVNDRVQEVSTSTGSGPFVLGGGVTGYQTFSVGIGNTNSTYYTITNGTNWMDILGTYTSAANSITVDKILTSSAGGTTAVSFAAGTKNIFCTYPAATAVLAAPAAYPTTQPTLNLDFANTKQLDPRITFVRNSTATYYDGQTTALAEQNLLLQSQGFSNAVWLKPNHTIGTGFTAPDGTATANKLICNNGTLNSAANISQVTTGINYTNTGVLFDLSTGVVGSYFIGTFDNTPTCTSFGNGWYRCAVYKNGYTYSLFAKAGEYPCIAIQVANSSVYAYSSTLSTSIAGTGDGTSGIYIWGAQLEQRSSATAYTPTTTSAITNYIPVLMTAPAGVARFDCDPITRNSLGLLIEESRTNLLNFSSSFATSGGSQNNWADTNITRTAAAFVAPDSTQVGIQFTASAANATVISTAAVGTSLARTFSVWLKRISGTGVINYTLDNGATWIAQTITSTVTRYTFTATTANQQVGFQIVTAGDSIGIWGAQLEAGAFATSYIASVASTVTRAADAASMTGTNFSSWYNQAQGSFYQEVIPLSTGGVTGDVFAVKQGTTSNYILSRYNSDQSPILFVNGAAKININPGTQPVGVLGKQAWSHDLTVFTTSRNAGTPVTATATVPVPTMDTLSIGSYSATVHLLNGYIRKLSYYPVVLSSSNLVALTS